jgi:flagellar motor switch protein FliM
MLYIYKGFLGGNGKVEKFCLFNEEDRSADFFRTEEKLIEFIVDNYCTEYNNISNECEPWILKALKGKFNFEVTKRLTSTEMVYLIDRTKTVLY